MQHMPPHSFFLLLSLPMKQKNCFVGNLTWLSDSYDDFSNAFSQVKSSSIGSGENLKHVELSLIFKLNLSAPCSSVKKIEVHSMKTGQQYVYIGYSRNLIEEELQKKNQRLCYDDKLRLFSWKEMSKICDTLFDHLPAITRREEQDEILALFKTRKEFPPTEALFIGLQVNSSAQVGILILNLQQNIDNFHIFLQ